MTAPPILPPPRAPGLPPVRRRVHITWQLVAGWLAAAAVAIPGILPILPPELVHAAPWLRPALTLAAVIIGAVLRSPASPTNESVEALRASLPSRPQTIRGDIPAAPSPDDAGKDRPS